MPLPHQGDENYPAGKGPRHPRAKLSAAEVEEMRTLRESDPKLWTCSRLAARFGIGRAQAYRICEFQQWTGDIVRWP